MKPEDIKKASDQFKPGGANYEWAQLSAAYNSANRSRVTANLQKLGVGLADVSNPLDLSGLLTQAVDRASVVYAQPPSRWLVRNGVRISEDDPQHLLMLRILDRGQYNLAWRQADRLRTLQRQIIIRFYPSPEDKGVVLRLFEPHHVHRIPSMTNASNIASDSVVMLELGGGRYEIWTRTDSGRRVEWTDEKGEAVDEAMEPEHAFPLLISYPQFDCGQAWLPPRQDQLAWTDNLSNLANMSEELAFMQGHNLLVYLRDNPANKLPSVTGPGVVVTIDRNEDLKNLAPSPAITQCLEALKVLGRYFALTNCLPANEFDPERQVLTGAALRVLMAPLLSKREDQVELVPRDERRAWAIISSLWNSYAPDWGEDTVDESLGLQLEVPDLEAPTTDTEAGNRDARQLLMGTASVIDIIQRDSKCTRQEAIEKYARIKQDNEDYPPRPQNPQAVITGPRPADPPGPTPPNNAPDIVTGDSVVGELG